MLARRCFYVFIVTMLLVAATAQTALADDAANAQMSALLTLVNSAPDSRTKLRLLTIYSESLKIQSLNADASPLVKHLALTEDLLSQQKALDDQQAAHDAAQSDVDSQTQCKRSTRLQGALTGAAASIAGDYIKRATLIGSLILPFLAYPKCDEAINQQVPAAPSPQQKALLQAQIQAATDQLRADARTLPH